MRSIETKTTDFIAGLAPWLAPIPTAYLVGRATLGALAWPLPVAICAAAIVESLGLAATNTALTLWEYNHARRKTDPAAPFTLAAGLVGVYVAVAVGLTVALDVAPSLARYAPAIWPGLSLTGVTLLGLRADHARRLEAIQAEKQERKAEARARQQTAQETHKPNAQGQAHKASSPGRAVGQNGAQNEVLDAVNRTRAAQRKALLDALLDAYKDNPDLGATEAARALGVHRNSIYNYTQDLIEAGRLHKNGHGWEVK